MDMGETSNGRRLGVWDCYKTPNQEFLLGTDIVYKQDVTKCVDFWGVDPVRGNHLQIWDCSDLHYHKWRYNEVDSTIRFEIGDHELCMTTEWQKTDNGTPVILWECDGTPQQQWALADDEGNVYTGSSHNVPFIVTICLLSLFLGVSLTFNCFQRRRAKKLANEKPSVDGTLVGVAIGNQQVHQQLDDEMSNMSNQA